MKRNDEILMTNDEGMWKLVSLCLLVIVFMMPLDLAIAAQRDVEMLIVTGAPGDDEYAEKFEKQVTTWKTACVKSGIAVEVIGKDEHDAEALEAFQRLSKLEGIIPALETSHAIAYLEILCPQLADSPKIIINCSGRGDKDVQTAAKFLIH
jgi:hypothetical protein